MPDRETRSSRRTPPARGFTKPGGGRAFKGGPGKAGPIEGRTGAGRTRDSAAGAAGAREAQADPASGKSAGRHAGPELFLARGVRIVYEDHDVLVVDKPIGLVTADPNDTGDRAGRSPRTLFDMIKAHVRDQGPGHGRGGAGPGGRGGRIGSRSLRNKIRKDGGLASDARRTGGTGGEIASDATKAFVIHRLDKDASGLLVFAKTPRAFNWLKEDFKAKRVHRLYVALAEGASERLGEVGATGSVQTPIPDDAPAWGKMRGRRTSSRGSGDQEDGAKPAVTHFKVLGVSRTQTPIACTLLEVRLETGRKNQIRVHMQGLGHSLVGDERFGARTNAIGRLGLHAAELGFTHPVTGETLRFGSPAPSAFYRAVGLKKPGMADGAEREDESGDSSSPSAIGAKAPSKPTPFPLPLGAGSSGESKQDGKGARRDTSWEPVANWYDQMLEPEAGNHAAANAPVGNDHYSQTILPGAMRLIEPSRGMRVLDLACGQGILSRRLAALGCEVVGVDASAGLIEAARKRSLETRGSCRFEVADARDLARLGLSAGSFDRVACVMALSNIDPLEPVLGAVSQLLKPGGSLSVIITHPAFRAIGQTHWGWDEKNKTQYRRVDGYLSNAQKRVEMHPGKAARKQQGGDAVTWTFHRPLQTYVAALAKVGLFIDRLEEWPSMRASDSGPRAAEENRARREIPLFLGLRAVRVK